MHTHLRRAFGGTCALLGAACLATAIGAEAPRTERIGPTTLRGYGQVEAIHIRGTATSGRYAVLRVTCANADKAALFQAKYLSDLRALPGTADGSVDLAGTPAPAVEAQDQGWIVAARQGRTVLILAGESPSAVAAAWVQAAGPGAGWAFTSTAAVPAYLDKWDRHGFAFYHRTWETPNKDNAPHLTGYDYTAPYNFEDEFRYAQRQRCGLVFWAREMMHDRAAGLSDLGWMDWTAQAARKYGIAFQVQPTFGDGTVWWANRFRTETQARMPGFVGGFHSVNDWYHGGVGYVSWCSERGKDQLLAVHQRIVSHYADAPSLITVMEPHCEVAHGEYDILTEYGPLADASFRRFLQEERRFTLTALNTRWEMALKSWDEVRVPEVASFLGWGPEAFDLAGPWQVHHADLETGRQLRLSAPDLDTTTWGQIIAPGHDRQMFLPKQPAWFRRTFTLPDAWLHSRQGRPIRLFLWDLNQRNDKRPVVVFLNGQLIGRDVREHGIGLTILDVTAALSPGRNVLAVHLPDGYIAYRTYLAAYEPRDYPYLGRALNARWVDFRDWVAWTRAQALRRGMEMIRRVLPDVPINLAAPDSIADLAKDLAVRYGGFFHNTGYMSAFYADYFPRLMRSAGLPSSAEPGGPARTLEELKRYWWKVVLTGLQGYNYFIHIGNILWDPAMRAWFERQQPMIHLLGKYHLPDTRVASLSDPRCDRLLGWPWYRHRQASPRGGYWWACVAGRLAVPADLLTPRDVARGDLARYDVLYDEMNTILSEETLDRLAAWVRDGGTFVTLVHTGRHTELEPDSWPVRRLTGCDVAWVGRTFDDGHSENFPLKLEPGQTVFDPAYWAPPRDPEVFGRANGPWPGLRGNGIGLKPFAPECQVLMRWAHDQSVAVARRPLGKGQVFAVGVKFFEDRFWWGNRDHQDRLVNDILAAGGVRNPVDARVNGKPSGGGAALHDAPAGRWFVSNNGLYDVHMLCNHGAETAEMVLSVAARAGTPAWAWDVQAGQPLAGRVVDGRLVFPALRLEPLELRALLVPRGRILDAPAEWLRLQLGWWAGTDAPRSQPASEPWPYVLDLSQGWSLQPAEGADPAALSRVGAPMPTAATIDLGAWTYAVDRPPRHALLRREFAVPAAWTDGDKHLHVSSFFASTFVHTGQVWMDGKLVRDWHPDRVEMRLTDVLTPASRHALVLEVKGTPFVGAVRGSAFLEYEPRPQEEMPLAGPWTISPDGLTWQPAVSLPGLFEGRLARRTVALPRAWEASAVMIHAVTEGRPTILAVIVNGRMIRRHHHLFGNRLDLNIGPLLRYGADNEIELVADSPGKVRLCAITLRRYAPDKGYP